MSKQTVRWIRLKMAEGLDRATLSKMREAYTAETGSSIGQTTWMRCIRAAFSTGVAAPLVESVPQVLKHIGERYTQSELASLARGESSDARLFGSPLIVSTKGTHLKFGVISDLHIGSKYFHPTKLQAAFRIFREEGVKKLLIPGDITEGMNSREGHVFECTHIGYESQREYTIKLLHGWDRPGEWMYAIDGNHDRWFGKRAGAKVVLDLERSLPNLTFLGHDEGDLILETPDGDCWIKLWHGEDGASYATSYRVQKLIESLTGGQKPHILITGHIHKQGYFVERNIHTIMSGCIQNQTKWMRAHRLPAHVGFWIVDFTMTRDGVTRFKPEWFPFFEGHPDQQFDSAEYLPTAGLRVSQGSWQG